MDNRSALVQKIIAQMSDSRKNNLEAYALLGYMITYLTRKKSTRPEREEVVAHLNALSVDTERLIMGLERAAASVKDGFSRDEIDGMIGYIRSCRERDITAVQR